MSKYPKISIVIPGYSIEGSIAEWQKSVMSKNIIDYLVVDNCGTDKSIAIAEQLIAGYNGKVEFHILHYDGTIKI